MSATNFPPPFVVGGVPTMGMNGLPLTTGQVFFCDYVNGSDGNTGQADQPVQTIYRAYAKCVSGRGDTVVIVSNGLSSGSQRLSLALAQSVDPTATTGTLTWAKNNTHLIGMCAPTKVAQRARIAPPTGTYTEATFNSLNFVVVTGSGCIFKNFSVYQGFSTGAAGQIAWTDNGNRNYYENVDIAGMQDAESATDASSRTLKIGSAGAGEHTFVGCTFGGDTVDRTAANATLEFAGGTPRNSFINCIFPMRATNAGVLSILATGASAIDRWNLFRGCWFLNAMSSGATAQTVIASMTSASPGGYLVMDNCAFVGDASTNWGGANAMANTYIMGATPTAATNGIGINPT